MTVSPSIAGARLLRLYPRSWRLRHEADMLAVLATRPLRVFDRLDLVRGALDAHLHPDSSSIVPGLTAIAGGGAWTLIAIVIAAQPAPLDWPGYLLELIPVALAGVALLLPALIGAWLRTGDSSSPFDHLAIDVAAGGYLAWAGALALANLGLEYGALIGAAESAAAIGTWLVAVSLSRVGQWQIATLLAVAPIGLIHGSAVAWAIFGATWTAIGLVELRDRDGVTVGVDT